MNDVIIWFADFFHLHHPEDAMGMFLLCCALVPVGLYLLASRKKKS